MQEQVTSANIPAITRKLLANRKPYISITREEMAKFCKSCADHMERSNLREVKIPNIRSTSWLFEKAATSKIGKADPGFFRRCMDSDAAAKADDPEAFCAYLHKKVLGTYSREHTTKESSASFRIVGQNVVPVISEGGPGSGPRPGQGKPSIGALKARHVRRQKKYLANPGRFSREIGFAGKGSGKLSATGQTVVRALAGKSSKISRGRAIAALLRKAS